MGETKKESMVVVLLVGDLDDVEIDCFDGGFVVGCVSSRSSSGVLRAMVNCDDIGREDCGCDVGWKD